MYLDFPADLLGAGRGDDFGFLPGWKMEENSGGGINFQICTGPDKPELYFVILLFCLERTWDLDTGQQGKKGAVGRMVRKPSAQQPLSHSFLPANPQDGDLRAVTGFFYTCRL